MHELFGLVGRHAELHHRIPLKTAGQLAIPLFGSHCCTESHDAASILTLYSCCHTARWKTSSLLG